MFLLQKHIPSDIHNLLPILAKAPFLISHVNLTTAENGNFGQYLKNIKTILLSVVRKFRQRDLKKFSFNKIKFERQLTEKSLFVRKLLTTTKLRYNAIFCLKLRFSQKSMRTGWLDRLIFISFKIVLNTLHDKDTLQDFHFGRKTAH